MKLKTFTTTMMASAIAASFSAQAINDRYIIQVDNPSKGIIKALAKQHGADIKIDSDGFIAATFTGKTLDQVKGLMNNPNIRLIEEDLLRYPMAVFKDDAGDPMNQQITPYGYYQAEAGKVQFDANSGMKVCVIDSGLDSTNPDFLWNRITGDNDPGTGNWFENGGPHGTHVSGTIGAADNSFGVIGMAPGVSMHIIKVFNAAGWGYSSDLAHAANLCSAAGANIINMSLGGGGANNTEENAFEAFRDAGGLSIAAAGNDGNDVPSYPAAYSSVMMVGAADADSNIAEFSQFPDCMSGKGKKATFDETICVEIAAGGVDTLSTFPAGTGTSSNFTADAVTINSAAMENFGSASGQTHFMGTGETTDAAASGKICLIDRGNISFHDKVANCEASGGIGAIIINNVSGMLFGTLGDTNTTTIPTIGTALEDRNTILAANTVEIAVSASDYSSLSGTSMATPTVAGVAALVWSNHPTCTGEEIRAALKASAEDQGAPGHDVYFGYGLVKAGAANTYLTTNGCAGGTTPPGGEFTLSVNGYKVRGYHTVDLNWSGANGTSVDIYRDGLLVATTENNGTFTDSLNSKARGVSYVYQVCEANASTCTETATASF